MGKFKKGIFFGSLVGAGLTWLFTTKEGREMRGKIETWAHEVFDELKGKIGETEIADQAKYNTKVQKVLEEYGKRKKVPAEAMKKLEQILKAQWKKLKKS